MSWTYRGYRIFYDSQGDAVDTICELCMLEVPDEQIYPQSSDPLDQLFGPHVYETYHMEVDSPLHCDWCERPLTHSLTDDGIRYILDALNELIHTKDGRRRKILVKDYRKRETAHRLGSDRPQFYDGSPGYALLLDWNEQLQYYTLEDGDYDLAIEFMDRILELEGSLRFKFYWKKEAFADKVTRPFERMMRRRYRKVMQEIEEF